MNLFAYGTLIFEDIWQQVVGRAVKNGPAELQGYEVKRVVDDLYPVIQPAPAERASGVIYFDLTTTDLARLDQYESHFYERIEVHPVNEKNERITCQTYVLSESYSSLASEDTWTVQWFADHAKAEYMKRLS
ncbi:MAG: gamma-glutamylcyclotransferase family protein [Lacipirellulaceae bacterium]